jgi:hypothetical protein
MYLANPPNPEHHLLPMPSQQAPHSFNQFIIAKGLHRPGKLRQLPDVSNRARIDVQIRERVGLSNVVDKQRTRFALFDPSLDKVTRIDSCIVGVIKTRRVHREAAFNTL